MICPICNKGELKEDVLLRGLFVKRKEVMTYCPICDFSKVRKIKLSKTDVERVKDEIEHHKKMDLLKNQNTKIQVKDTKYDQSYLRR